jgi:hypothetical protein
LISDIVQVRTDDMRLRADSQDVVAHPLDQGGLPAHSHGAFVAENTLERRLQGYEIEQRLVDIKHN